jgi:hypothetical protein
MSAPIFYGSATFIADGQLTLTDNTLASQPGSSSYSLTWSGTEAGIDAKAAELELAGYPFQRRKAEGRFMLTAVFATDPSVGAVEVPADVWGFDDEVAQIDIYSHPRAWTYLADEGAASAHIAKQSLENYISAGLAPTSADHVFDSSPAGLSANALYLYRVSGGTHYDLKRPVLFRQREFSVAYAPRRVIENVPKFYTRSRLITEFSIPTVIANQIPDDPADTPPSGTAWGWKERQDNSQTIPRSGRITERRDWVFAAYSTYFFDLQS